LSRRWQALVSGWALRIRRLRRPNLHQTGRRRFALSFNRSAQVAIGRFGYVLDLKRLAADREKVIPGRPAESELWALVEHDEMPPSDSPHGPLTPSQKETIRDWIAAGSPE
jgi:hypothetical protein